MNKQILFGILAVVVLGAGGIIAANLLAEPEAGGTEIRTTEQVIENPRQAPAPRPGSFTVMSPEQKAAAEEVARLAAEAATNASSSASSTATSTASTTEAAESN